MVNDRLRETEPMKACETDLKRAVMYYEQCQAGKLKGNAYELCMMAAIYPKVLERICRHCGLKRGKTAKLNLVRQFSRYAAQRLTELRAECPEAPGLVELGKLYEIQELTGAYVAVQMRYESGIVSEETYARETGFTKEIVTGLTRRGAEMCIAMCRDEQFDHVEELLRLLSFDNICLDARALGVTEAEIEEWCRQYLEEEAFASLCILAISTERTTDASSGEVGIRVKSGKSSCAFGRAILTLAEIQHGPGYLESQGIFIELPVLDRTSLTRGRLGGCPGIVPKHARPLVKRFFDILRQKAINPVAEA